MSDRTGAPAPADPAAAPGKTHPFSFTYDDTGETVRVHAPSDWTMQHVIDQAYKELEETAQPDDRVEFDGRVLTVDQREMDVKEFLAHHINPSGKFHIVSKPGGAAGAVR